MENKEIVPIRCSQCGRFWGYGLILEGAVWFYCHNCKGITQFASEDFSPPLTAAEVCAIFNSKGRKARGT